MVQAWIKIVPADEIIDGEAYFLAVDRGTGLCRSYMFYSTDIKGKKILSSKPGIAIHVAGNEKLRTILREKPDHVAIQIPADADRRWARRKKRTWKRST
ncbi:hypothetical protein [Chromobacterium haemolyticum]|uniref:hypothetical protein n=1 Tax=Chromobacterium haemolyticum TaxID=394935 RepID=UPI00131865AA|nr:hypothetical protein [Chromobacterium haemolyticum]BBH11781.1 hypothetical protein CH06BL_10290 [Chromobacterium haemolyticum]